LAFQCVWLYMRGGWVSYRDVTHIYMTFTQICMKCTQNPPSNYSVFQGNSEAPTPLFYTSFWIYSIPLLYTSVFVYPTSMTPGLHHPSPLKHMVIHICSGWDTWLYIYKIIYTCTYNIAYIHIQYVHMNVYIMGMCILSSTAAVAFILWLLLLLLLPMYGGARVCVCCVLRVCVCCVFT